MDKVEIIIFIIFFVVVSFWIIIILRFKIGVKSIVVSWDSMINVENRNWWFGFYFLKWLLKLDFVLEDDISS